MVVRYPERGNLQCNLPQHQNVTELLFAWQAPDEFSVDFYCETGTEVSRLSHSLSITVQSAAILPPPIRTTPVKKFRHSRRSLCRWLSTRDTATVWKWGHVLEMVDPGLKSGILAFSLWPSFLLFSSSLSFLLPILPDPSSTSRISLCSRSLYADLSSPASST